MDKEPSEKKASDVDQQIQWAMEELKLSRANWQRRASASDILYLLDQCPFLQITDVALQLETDLPPLKLVSARSGWKIHHYGNALSSSPGELLFGGYRRKGSKEEDQRGGEGTGNPGTGTIVNQAVITAFEMIEIAKQGGWSAIQLIDGHPLMVWAAWMQSLESGIQLEGYTPTAKDYAKWRRIKGVTPTREIGYKPMR